MVANGILEFLSTQLGCSLIPIAWLSAAAKSLPFSDQHMPRGKRWHLGGPFSVICCLTGQSSSLEGFNLCFSIPHWTASSQGWSTAAFWASPRTSVQHKPTGKYLIGKISNYPCWQLAKHQVPYSHPCPNTSEYLMLCKEPGYELYFCLETWRYNQCSTSPCSLIGGAMSWLL